MPHNARATPENAPQCPLCGRPNVCAPAQSGTFATPCWCIEASFPPELLSRVPEALRGHACICRACTLEHAAQAAAAAAAAATSPP